MKSKSSYETKTSVAQKKMVKLNGAQSANHSKVDRENFDPNYAQTKLGTNSEGFILSNNYLRNRGYRVIADAHTDAYELKADDLVDGIPKQIRDLQEGARSRQ